ncbi:NlpC/P60 family protein [Streptomyces sp. NPDC099050]|uniref:NlpC/P60 family protein n=1 Tax=Streptomyces sp. NPDC099050 TaxID=3366100 RepID=UPI00382371D6
MRPVTNTSRRTLLAALAASTAAPLAGLTASPAAAAPAVTPAAPAALNTPMATTLASSGMAGPRSSVTLTGPAHDIAALTRASVGALTATVLPGTPARTVIRSDFLPLAVLTKGSRTVLMTGPERTFMENKRLVTDKFERVQPAGSWGNSPDGGSWSVFGGLQATAPGPGQEPVNIHFTLAKHGAACAELRDTTSARYGILRDEEITDFDAQFTAQFDRVPAGNACSFALVFAYRGNGTDAATHFRARLSFTTGNEVQLRVEKVVGATDTLLKGPFPIATGVPAETDFTIRVRREGARVQIKAWRTAQSERPEWTTEFTDSTPAFAKGAVGVRAVASEGCTNFPIVMSMSRFALTEATWEKPPTVTHSHWVRLLDAPYDGNWTPAVEDVIRGWSGSLAPDVFAYAATFLPGAPPVVSGRKAPVGAQVLGKAGYGKTNKEGLRPVGADFHDYMGQPWTFPGQPEKGEEAGQAGNLDCSGFVRMVYGYHMGLPLCDAPFGDRRALPRKSGAMAGDAPGVGVATKPADNTALPANTALQPGDLLFFDANDPGDEPDEYAVDHVGFYLGVDADGQRRFLSSRKSCNGPTMADLQGSSLLDGSGTYATKLRSVHRV